MTLQELNQLQYLKREIEIWEQHLASDPLPGVPRSSPMAQESNRLIQGNIEKGVLVFYAVILIGIIFFPCASILLQKNLHIIFL